MSTAFHPPSRIRSSRTYDLVPEGDCCNRGWLSSLSSIQSIDSSGRRHSPDPIPHCWDPGSCRSSSLPFPISKSIDEGNSVCLNRAWGYLFLNHKRPCSRVTLRALASRRDGIKSASLAKLLSVRANCPMERPPGTIAPRPRRPDTCTTSLYSYPTSCASRDRKPLHAHNLFRWNVRKVVEL